MNYRDDELWAAVGARDLNEVERCVRQGGNVNMVCPDSWVRSENAGKKGTGRSLLHHAAWAGDERVFRHLVENGADIGRRRNTAWRPNGGVRGRGATPLHHAVMYNRASIVDYLLSKGADVNEPGEQGFTPLHIAAKFNYPHLVEKLLQRGARGDMITRDEKTARDLAAGQQDRSHHQMGRMLELFDKYASQTKAHQRPLPGAPLPPLPPASIPEAVAENPLPSVDALDEHMSAVSSQFSVSTITTDSTSSRTRPGGTGDDLPSSHIFGSGKGSNNAARTDSNWGPSSQYASSSVPQPAYHNSSGATQNVGNVIGTKPTTRQSKLFRMYESGNAVKGLLGQEGLQWDVTRKQGAYQGPTWDDGLPKRGGICSGDGREVLNNQQLMPSTGRRLQSHMEQAESPWTTSSNTYGSSRQCHI
ncbi:hypothetical protein CYMTET_6208 [Cymbomonas tetramitiformis]|uniref:Uncharacterized protein n=1 Tax=Cymbomonas tetramitiformis TaxID=36881 RepID=A0AAE0GXL3_9CHLO|nr:hypothetical protein CYMTET_6208 [Cymbomonas tetramitiformis]